MNSQPAIGIGIDVGTTFCCVAVLRPHETKPEIIPNDQGKNTTPSFVAFVEDEEEEDVYAGEAAKAQAYLNPESTVFDIKRLIGRSYFDPHIQKYKKLWPFHLVNQDGFVGVSMGTKRLLPQKIITELLLHLLESVKAFLRCPVESAVITVPAYFNDLQLGLMREACNKANLTTVHFITEPSAAAYAYGLHSFRGPIESKTCLIFDLGGGTFDVTLFTLSPNKRLQVLATGGDARLGGEDFNDLLTEYCLVEFEKLHGINLAAGKTSEDETVRGRTAKVLRRIRSECEKQKCFLSTTQKVVISLDGVHENIDFAITMSRSIFEDLIDGHLKRCMGIVENILQKAGIERNAVDDVVLIGGSSRIPKVQRMLSEYFGGRELHKNIHADEAVACGAAVYAYNLLEESEAGGAMSAITVVNETTCMQPYASICNVNPLELALKAEKETIHDTETIVTKQMNELHEIRDWIKRLHENFSNKTKEILEWLRNLELIENEFIKNPSSPSLQFTFLLKALLDTPLLEELARILSEKYFYSDALILNEKLFERKKTLLGADHLDTIKAQLEVAICLDEMNSFVSTATNALDLYNLVYEKRSRILGPDHEDTLKVKYYIAWIFVNHEKHQEAYDMASELLKKQKKILGESHCNLFLTEALIAYCWTKLEDERALPILTDLHKNKILNLDLSKRETTTQIWNVAFCLSEHRKYNEALELFNRVYKHSHVTLGPNHTETLAALSKIAKCLTHLKNYTRAVEIFTQTYDAYNGIHGPTHEKTLTAQYLIAWVLGKQGKVMESLSLFKTVHEKCTEYLGHEHETTVNSKNWIEFYEKEEQ